jgi:integrase
MSGYVYRKTRIKNGKKVKDRTYRGRFKLDGELGQRDVALKVSDKQVAEKKLRELIKEAEQERAGIIAPRLRREAAQAPLESLMEEFLADVKGRGRTPAYTQGLRTQITRLMKAGNWKKFPDITPISFINWRNNSTLAPKTKNEYLAAIKEFIAWLVKYGKAESNSLKTVPKLENRQINPRRALTNTEVSALLDSAGIRKPIYMTALYTGLRRNELRQLEWGDVHFNANKPHIKARANTTKNKKNATLPLHRDLVEILKSIKPKNGKQSDRVFAGELFSSSRQQERDFRNAGIQKRDHLGRVADFHCLRHTYCTMLANAGVPLRTAQALMRHSDPKLTANIYTDENALQLADSVNKLDWLEPNSDAEEALKQAPESCPHIGTQTTGILGHSGSQPVTHLSDHKKTSESLVERSGGELTCHNVTNKMVVGTGFEPVNRLPEQIYSLRALAACISHRFPIGKGGRKWMEADLPRENWRKVRDFSKLGGMGRARRALRQPV